VDGNDQILENDDNRLQIPTGYSQLNFMQKFRYTPSEFWYFDYGFQNPEMEIFSEETMSGVFGWENGESAYGRPYGKNRNLGTEARFDREFSSSIQFAGGASVEYYETYDVKSYASANITGRPLELDGIVYKPYEYLGELKDISENANWLRESQRTITAVYGQGTFDIRELLSIQNGIDALSLTAGVRYDRYSDFGSTVNPRLGLTFSPISDMYIKVLYGSAFRAPTVKEMYSINNPVRHGNPNLKPEKIYTFETQVGYNLTQNISANITYFNILANDIIQSQGMTTVNTGIMKSAGVEAEMKLRYSQEKYAYCNFTYQDVKNTTRSTIVSDTGRKYTQESFFPGSVASVLGNLGFNYDITKYLIGNIYLNYVGEKKRSNEKIWSGESLEHIDSRPSIDPCLLANLSFTIQDVFDGIRLQLSMYNLLNSDHRDPDPDGKIKNDLPRELRSFQMRISYVFGSK